MMLNIFSRLLRPTAVLLLIAVVLLLGAQSAVWATPAQEPYGQTVPTKTPKPTKTSKPTKAPEPTKTPKPTHTPKPTKTPGQPGGPCTQEPVQAPINGDSPITLEVCPWSVSADGAAFTSAGTLQLQLAAAGVVPQSNAGYTFVGPQAEVTVFDTAGNPIPQPALAKPITVCYNYTAAEAAQAAGNPANFTLQSFGAGSQAWADLATSIDANNSRVCASPTHLSLFALATRLRPSMLPRTAASPDPAVSKWLLGVIALALVIGLALRSGRLVRRARTQR